MNQALVGRGRDRGLLNAVLFSLLCGGIKVIPILPLRTHSLVGWS